jgi:hypothetical protein
MTLRVLIIRRKLELPALAWSKYSVAIESPVSFCLFNIFLQVMADATFS